MDTNKITLSDYLRQTLASNQHANHLGSVLQTIANTTVQISNLVRQGALAGVTGKMNSQNVQGETQMQLDVLTNDMMIADLRKCGVVAGIASEEMDAPVHFDSTGEDHFLVIFDPLDGSSNVAVNAPIGTIFSVLDAVDGRPAEDKDYLQQGRQQLAAGYAVYGASTMLMLTVGNGAQGFTLDTETGCYVLTHPDLRIPEVASEFAINASNERHWESAVYRYVEECKAGAAGVRGRDFNMRWVGSMVADIHRILMRGGIYIYPRDNKLPIKAGRLRLMYEANPMSLLIEQAGGLGSTGRARILDVQPEQIHQRVPVIIGSQQEVSLLEWYHQQADSGEALKQNSPLFGDRSLFQRLSNQS